MSRTKHIAIAAALILLALCLCVCAGAESAEYKRVAKLTPVYLEPSEEEMFQAGYFLNESTVLVLSRPADGWAEVEYMYDPSLKEDSDPDAEAEQRIVYIREQDLLKIADTTLTNHNAIISQEAATGMETTTRSRFVPELLMDMGYLSVLPDPNATGGLTYTVRTKVAGNDADYRDVLAVQTRQPYQNNNKFIYIPQIELDHVLKYPVNGKTYGLPGADSSAPYSTTSDYITDPKVIAGLRVILENSPPYKVYTGYTSDYMNASRYAAGLALQAYLADTASAGEPLDLYSGIAPYNASEFSADYLGYACWLYETAMRTYTGYSENEASYITCDIQDAPVWTKDGFKTTVRITTNAETGWKIEKNALDRSIKKISGAETDENTYFGPEGSTVITILASQNLLGSTVTIPVSYNSDDPVVQFSVPENAEQYPVLVSLTKQTAKNPAKQMQIEYPSSTVVTVTLYDGENNTPLDGITIRLKSKNGNTYSKDTEDGTAVFECIPDVYAYDVLNMPKAYEDVPSGEIDAKDNAELALTSKGERFSAEIRIVNAFTKEIVEAPCEIEVYRQGETPEKIYSGSPVQGIAEVGNLVPGEYFVRQLTELKGYTAVEGDITFRVQYEDLQVEVPNSPLSGVFKASIRDGNTSTPVEGVTAEILLDDTVVGEMTSDKDGIMTSSPLPAGNYTVRLKELPDGITLRKQSDAEIKSSLKYKKITELKWIVYSTEYKITVYPREAGSIENYEIKAPSRTGISSVSTCAYQLIAAEDSKYYQTGDIVAEFSPVSEKRKTASVQIRHPGLYIVHETNPGTGYLLAEDTQIEVVEEKDTYTAPILKIPVARNVRISKTDAEGNPVSGITYYLYRSNYKNYSIADIKDRRTAVTDDYGNILLENLPYGEWTVEESGEGEPVKTKIMVDLDSPEEIVVGTEEIAVSNASVRIRVKDQNGKPVHESIGFEITRDGTAVAAFTAAGTGYYEGSLEDGEYILRQTTETSGYKKAEDVPFTVENGSVQEEIQIQVSQADKNLSVSVQVPVIGSVKSSQKNDDNITTDTLNKEYAFVPDASVTIFENIFAKPVLSIRTGGSGATVTTPVPVREYLVFIGNIPEGYTLRQNPVRINLGDYESTMVPVDIQLEPDPTMIACTLSEPIKGAKNGANYGLYAVREENDTTESEKAKYSLIDTKKAIEGYVLFAGVYAHGNYMVAPVVDLNGNPDIDAAALFEIGPTARFMAVKETPNYAQTVILRAEDAETGAALDDAYVQITQDNEVLFEGYIENGNMEYSLKKGEYRLRSILAPSGYALPEQEDIRFTVAADGGITGDPAVRFSKNVIRVRVTDQDNVPVPGADYVLTENATERSIHQTTDKDGIAVFTHIGYGDYKITECFPAPGYIPNRSTISVMVDGAFRNNGKTAELKTGINQLLFRVVDIYGDPVQGAELVLTNSQSSVLQSALSGEDGICRLTAIPYGVYTVRMNQVPENVLKSTTEYPLTVGYNSEAFSQMYTFVCIPKHAAFRLVDREGKGVYGSEFSLISKDTAEIVETALSDKEGRFAFSRFEYGEYIVRETRAKDKTAVVDDYELIIDRDNYLNKTILFRTFPDYYDFNVIDNKGNPLPNMLFGLRNLGTERTVYATSDETGRVHFSGLKPGEYEIRQEGVPKAYRLSGETLHLHVDENYTPPETLYMFVIQQDAKE